jgi:hypothetical protein
MSGTGADGPVEGAKGEAGRLIITLGSGAVGAACVPDWGMTGTVHQRPLSPLFYQ